jgi:hypothetical protein
MEEVCRAVTVHMKRMAGLQSELDELRENVARLLSDSRIIDKVRPRRRRK